MGFGWTLNPGAINRQLRGYPDDAHSYPVRTYNKRSAVTTTAVELSESAEIMSFDKFSPTDTTQIGSVGENARLRLVHNSETGFRAVFSAGIQSLGVGLGLEVSDEGLSFRPSLNIYSLASGLARLSGMKRSKDPVVNAVVDNADNSVNGFQGSFLNWISTSEQQLSVTPSTGWSVRLSAGLTADPAFLPIGFEGRISGSYSETSLNPVTDRKAFGYFYSSSADEQSLMDYHTEKLDPYSERTLFLGIPFSLPDVFSVSGEGIGGSFRGHSTVAGQYYPPLSTSNHTIYHVDLSPHVGTTFGLGVSAGVGLNTVTSKMWLDGDAYRFTQANNDRRGRYVLRFTGDGGGYADFAGSVDGLAMAHIDAEGAEIPGLKHYSPTILGSDVSQSMNNGEDVGRAWFIGHHSNAKMQRSSEVRPDNLDHRVIRYGSETMSAAHREFVDRSDSSDGFQYQTGEYYAISPAGTRYVYGLPVYSRNEHRLSFGLNEIAQGIGSGSLQTTALRREELDSMHLAYRSMTVGGARVLAGEERKAPYASTYLLTEITTSDYRDRTYDGPTDDDLGGYTRFDYRRVAGSDNKSDMSTSDSWYRWRVPYNGMLYERNSLRSGVSTRERLIGGLALTSLGISTGIRRSIHCRFEPNIRRSQTTARSGVHRSKTHLTVRSISMLGVAISQMAEHVMLHLRHGWIKPPVTRCSILRHGN